MSQTGPWSVKGIDQRARDAAREAALAEGITLGEYLNRLLMTEGPQPDEIRHPRDRDYDRPRPDAAAGALDRLTRRIEATEARSTLAITGIDHTVLGLVARLQNAEQNTAAVAGHVEGLIDEMRATHEALQSKVRRLEHDDSPRQNLEALKALEFALGKLASHVYEEGELTENETAAIKGRVEAGFADLTERVEGMETRVDRTLSDAAARVERAVEQAELRAEGTARHLSERMSTLETNVHDRLAGLGNADQRLDAVEADVSGALSSMESTLLRIQDRLNRAETTTDSALKSLETTFEHLDARIDAVAKTVDPELADRLRREFEARFEDLTRSVRNTVDAARLELADEIARAASGQDGAVISDLKANIDGLAQRVGEIEARPTPDMTDDIREEIERLGQTVSTQIGAIAEQVETRIGDSEHRNAMAIEQVGEQVTVAAVRLQKRQDEALTALAQQIDETRKKTDARLSDALATVSDRFEQMHVQASTSLSPVQKAIATLATRLESLEAFTSPPHARPAAPIIPPQPQAAAPFAPIEPARSTAPDDAYSEIPMDRDEPFEPGLGSWDVAPAAKTPSPYQSPYQADFDAIRAAAERVGTVPPASTPVHNYVADLPATGASQPFDPLTELDDLDDDQGEARESDIFDDEEVEAEPRGTAAAAPVKAAAAPPARGDDPSDYIARARRAALAAQQENAKPARRGAKATAAPVAKPAKAGGSSKAPLYIAASAVVLTGAGVGGYLYLRGKQEAPTVAGPVDAYVDPGPGVPEPAIDVAETSDADMAAIAIADDESIDEALFDTAAGSELAAADDAPTSSGSTGTRQLMAVTMAPPAAAPSASFPPISPVITVESAAASGNHIAQYQLAQTLIADGKAEPGAAMMRRAAQKGLAIAQYDLGKLYEQGQGVPQDLAAAREWILKAAEGGNAKAMHDVASLFANGEGGPQSFDDAADWFRKAAVIGVADSQYNLGVLYAQGLGVAPNLTEALFWFEAAQNSGDTEVANDIAALRARVSMDAAMQARERADAWKPASPNALANGRFGAQPWNKGNPLQVQGIQTALTALGYELGAPDGVLGRATARAISDYQEAIGLAVTGSVTQELVDSLNASAASGPDRS